MAIDTTITYDDRFDKIDAQFAEMRDQFTAVNNQFATVNGQLDKLATAIITGFDRVDKALDAKAGKADLQRVYDLLDKIAKQQEIDTDERLIMGHQLERLDRWVHEVAAKIGYELTT